MESVLTRKRWLWIAGGVAFLLFYYFFDPLESRYMPQCIFHKITGWQCMGCGSQRVVHALLHGDIAAAWRANMFLVASLPILIFLVWVEFSRTRHPLLYKRLHTQWTIITITAMLFAWLFVRNYFGI